MKNYIFCKHNIFGVLGTVTNDPIDFSQIIIILKIPVTKWIENLCPHKNLFVYIRFIHNCQHLEATKIFFNRGMSE